jgi:hypothetical protein
VYVAGAMNFTSECRTPLSDANLMFLTSNKPVSELSCNR